jgi:hypothetical protein
MLSVANKPIMLSVVMLNVVMLSVVAPLYLLLAVPANGIRTHDLRIFYESLTLSHPFSTLQPLQSSLTFVTEIGACPTRRLTVPDS